jgi:hypothetical protein
MGEPTGVESEGKIYSSNLQEDGNFISGIDGISIKKGIEMGVFTFISEGGSRIDLNFYFG